MPSETYIQTKPNWNRLIRTLPIFRQWQLVTVRISEISYKVDEAESACHTPLFPMLFYYLIFGLIASASAK